MTVLQPFIRGSRCELVSRARRDRSATLHWRLEERMSDGAHHTGINGQSQLCLTDSEFGSWHRGAEEVGDDLVGHLKRR